MSQLAYDNLKRTANIQFIEEYNKPHYEARDLYDKRTSLKKTNFALRRLMKNPESKEPVKTVLEYKIIYLIMGITTQIELIRSTESTDGTSDEKESVFTGGKAVWYDRPFRELICNFYHGDINEFYRIIEGMTGNEIRTSLGVVPKNLALQFIQNLRLIVSGGSEERHNRGIFKIHHDLQIAPTHVVIILQALNITCQPSCVMKKSEAEYERGNAPKWLIDLADKPQKLNTWEDELTEEEKRVFAKAESSMIVMEGGCTCGHNATDHYYGLKCTGCECRRFIKRNDSKRIIEFKAGEQKQ